MGFAVVKPMSEDEYLASEAMSPVKRKYRCEYVLIAQGEVRVEVDHRVTLRARGLTTLGAAGTLELTCLSLALPVRDIYAGIGFDIR